MEIKLGILPHQTECINQIAGVFDSVDIKLTPGVFANPIFDYTDIKIKSNILDLQKGKLGPQIASELRTSVDGEFGIDIRMETGTGKTYCYTRLMYELNLLYGFNKFIILVPTTPIKEGTLSFIKSDYARQHFADLYPGKRIELSILNPQKTTNGRKKFPQAISDFARATRLETDKINALLMTSGMLLSSKTMAKEYDQTLLGTFSTPYDTLKATRPIVIIDEPHKFKRDNKAYKCLIEKINPLCVIRFGATFPELNDGRKDYNNLIFNLGPCEAFNNNLVKGVATQLIEQELSNETRVKVIDIKRSNPKSCVIRNEKNGKSYTLSENNSLSIVSDEFYGISIQSIGKTEEDTIKTGITLSNGRILVKGDQIYPSIYGTTYQELMLKQAIYNHIEQEKENFFRTQKIKTLTLFFIDSIESYRGEEGDGPLRIKFQDLLRDKLKDEKAKYENSTDEREQEYYSYLDASWQNIEKTNGGYFAEDNSTSDADIQKEVEQILRDKQSLLSFKDENGQWNTRRFIFSKWTLREGWDNPNVFQICKIRSSGSEVSKLQEVGRGLRLPVDELGNRIEKEQFYLTYLCDYSEQDFAQSLVDEINNERAESLLVISFELLKDVAAKRGLTDNELMVALLTDGYINIEREINADKKEEFFNLYPEFNTGLQANKVIDKSKIQQNKVSIRKDKFNEIKDLWKLLNEKYYLVLDSISDTELHNAILSILVQEIHEETMARAVERRVEFADDSQAMVKERTVKKYYLEETMPYGEFLKHIHRSTGISLQIMHNALCEYNKITKLDKGFFNEKTLSKFIGLFKAWFMRTFENRYSYRRLGCPRLETALTDIKGDPKESIIQGVIGVRKDSHIAVPDNYLYDQVVFDSPKECENIKNSEINEVVVFGKIPRRSIQVPLYFGGTTSPDFMYVIQKDSGNEINFIVETKDVIDDASLRDVEKRKIESAERFFQTLKTAGVNVAFKKQLKNDDIVVMIKNL